MVGLMRGVVVGSLDCPSPHMALQVCPCIPAPPAALTLGRRLQRGSKLCSPLSHAASSSPLGARLILLQRPQCRGVPRAQGGSGESSGSESSLAPLEPESPAGQVLAQILRSHPHLFPAAAEEQLERLGAEKEAEEAREQGHRGAAETDLVLFKRISDIRSSERKRAIEEVIYALIVQRFREGGMALLPQVPFLPPASLSPSAPLPPGSPSADRQLLAMHSEEAREMVLEHLGRILGGVPAGTPTMMDDRVLVQTTKLRMGQVYAASIMYGYFLRRVDQRFQLEKTMKVLAAGGGVWEAFEAASEDDTAEPSGEAGQSGPGEPFPARGDVAEMSSSSPSASGPGMGSREAPEGGRGSNRGALRQYIMSFDQDTLQQAATMRSREGINVIEKHTEALFGRPEMTMSPDGGLAVARDEAVRVTISTLRRTVLEAVAFGSFLWDVESYVDSRYKITNP